MNGMALILAQASEAASLSAGGAVIMTLSVSLVLGLNLFCFWRILREPEPGEHHHAPLEIDTQDFDT